MPLQSNIRQWLATIFLLSAQLHLSAQADTINHVSRQWIIGGFQAGVYGGSLIALNATWYQDYARTGFQVFDDSKEWLQIDKVGHAFSVYQAARGSTALWRWAGKSQKQAAIIGAGTGAAYLTVIEILDAHSAKWGWSWSDMGANIIGSGLFLSQELIWQQQKLHLKISFHRNSYRDNQLEARANDLFGKSDMERVLKDYNAQTYWLSANIKSFVKCPNLPSWLNVAAGYGGTGLFGGFENKWNDEGVTVSRYDVPRKRQWYLAPDIDFTKIKTNSKFIRSTLYVLNAFKFPTPGLEFSNGKMKGRWIAF